jgi:glycosyltransferase involved in cell wall biosynthesis
VQNPKILHIINVPWYNAVAWYGVNTALAQSRLGYEVHVAGDPASPSLKEAEKAGLTRLLRLPISTPNPVRQLISAGALRAYIEKNGIDVVNAHQGNGFYVVALAAHLAKNKPLLVRTRGDIRYPKKNIFNRLLYTRVSHGIIATSGVTFKRMTETFPIPENRIVTLVPGVDDLVFAREKLNPSGLRTKLGVPSECPLFGLIGRVDKNKGHRIALQAMKSVTDTGLDLRYVIAGPEADMRYTELKAIATELGIANRVILLGRVPDVREVMAACDCGIIASTQSEAICRVGLEFMSLRVPVIASGLNGIPDIIKDGESGLLFRTGDSADLADKIRNFLAMKAMWPLLKNNARRNVEYRHALSVLGQKSAAFYLSLLERRKA